MTIETLTKFFLWCTILNGGIYLLWTVFLIFAPDFVYRMQSRLFPIPRESYNVVIYSFLGLFKIIFVAFSLVPYVSLLIVG